MKFYGYFVEIILSLSLFLFSLNAFSVRATALSYGLILVLVIIKLPEFFKIKKSSLRAGGVLSIVFIFTMMASARHGIYFNFLLKSFFIFVYSYVLYVFFSERIIKRESINNCLKFLIIAHSLFFAIQILYYLLFGDIVDFNNYVREVESDSLYFTKALEGAALDIRGGGLFSEPSFYSMTVVPASIILLVNEKKIGVISFLGFSTAALSFSIAALLVVGLVVLFYFFVFNTDYIKKIILIVCLVFAMPFFSDFYDKRVIMAYDYDAVSSRSAIFDEFYFRPFIDDLIGSGFYWDENYIQGVTGIWGFQIRDSSFYAYLYYCGGAIGFVLFFSILWFSMKREKVKILFLLPVFLFKFHILYGVLFVFVLFMYLIDSNECQK
ncbi:hypothetical protein [Quatrionicoccus australiensis]|uniref:hypothetical protein n=1 Tax=Quatrionicoccus australiensis TaxID=138118 RepID=UPI001CF9D46E|nr:hypothetical protein [Quatrionicoccus australiensis]MCB4358669.1 hypothetical protein [Quatrionicoccus australiensis]